MLIRLPRKRRFSSRCKRGVRYIEGELYYRCFSCSIYSHCTVSTCCHSCGYEVTDGGDISECGGVDMNGDIVVERNSTKV